MIFFIIHITCTIILLSIILAYNAQDILKIIPDRVWLFFTFLCFVPILNIVILLTLMFNHDNPKVEDINEALKELEELDKKLKELSDKFNKKDDN